MLDDSTAEAIMAHQPQTLTDAWAMLAELKNIKAREGKTNSMARLSHIIAHLHEAGLPDPASYSLTHLAAESRAGLELRFVLLVMMVTRAHDAEEISAAETGDLGMSIFPDCVKAIQEPESAFPRTLKFDHSRSCPL